MSVELFEKFEVGKAEPDNFHPSQNLVRPRLEDFFGFIKGELVWSDQLHGSLGRWNVVCCHKVNRVG